VGLAGENGGGGEGMEEGEERVDVRGDCLQVFEIWGAVGFWVLVAGYVEPEA